jgi:DNA-binding NtrC family response regulator
MLTDALMLEGYQVDSAENGKVAGKVLQNGTYDLIITDIIMPERDGIEVLIEASAKNQKRTPVVVISGGGRVMAEHYLDIAHRLGAKSILTKPINLDDLYKAVSEALKN